jgi:hypothetical protein
MLMPSAPRLFWIYGTDTPLEPGVQGMLAVQAWLRFLMELTVGPHVVAQVCSGSPPPPFGRLSTDGPVRQGFLRTQADNLQPVNTVRDTGAFAKALSRCASRAPRTLKLTLRMMRALCSGPCVDNQVRASASSQAGDRC